MPRVNLNSPPSDPLRGMVLDRQYSYGKTQDDIAQVLGISRSTWNRMLRNGSATWTWEQVRKLCRYLDIPLNDARAVLPP